MALKPGMTAKMEPFDSFWEAPSNIEKGYRTFYAFYRRNYLKYFPARKEARILVISCGPGYMVHCLQRHGFTNVLGIDSDQSKIDHARRKGLNCQVASAVEFLNGNNTPLDVIFCEQELNHLTKAEIIEFLSLCSDNMAEGSQLIVHCINGANPITGAESLAQNFDHYNTLTEYALKQVLEHCGFRDIEVFPLTLYVFYTNPLNYLLMAVSALFTLFFRAAFMLYGKKNRIFTKKLAAACRR